MQKLIGLRIRIRNTDCNFFAGYFVMERLTFLIWFNVLYTGCPQKLQNVLCTGCPQIHQNVSDQLQLFLSAVGVLSVQNVVTFFILLYLLYKMDQDFLDIQQMTSVLKLIPIFLSVWSRIHVFNIKKIPFLYYLTYYYYGFQEPLDLAGCTNISVTTKTKLKNMRYSARKYISNVLKGMLNTRYVILQFVNYFL